MNIKFLSILFVLVLIIFEAYPQQSTEVIWLNWNDGYSKAKETDKILLIDLYTDWCGWCKKMDRDTYSSPEIINLINKHFIPVKLNPEKKDVKYEVEGKIYTGMQLYAMLVQNQSTGYPTTVFLFANAKTLQLHPGYQNAFQFKETLTKVIETKTQLN